MAIRPSSMTWLPAGSPGRRPVVLTNICPIGLPVRFGALISSSRNCSVRSCTVRYWKSSIENAPSSLSTPAVSKHSSAVPQSMRGVHSALSPSTRSSTQSTTVMSDTCADREPQRQVGHRDVHGATRALAVARHAELQRSRWRRGVDPEVLPAAAVGVERQAAAGAGRPVRQRQAVLAVGGAGRAPLGHGDLSEDARFVEVATLAPGVIGHGEGDVGRRLLEQHVGERRLAVKAAPRPLGRSKMTSTCTGRWAGAVKRSL